MSKTDTRMEDIRTLKKEVEDLKAKLEYEREIKEAYRTFWLDTKKYKLYESSTEDKK